MRNSIHLPVQEPFEYVLLQLSLSTLHGASLVFLHLVQVLLEVLHRRHEIGCQILSPLPPLVSLNLYRLQSFLHGLKGTPQVLKLSHSNLLHIHPGVCLGDNRRKLEAISLDGAIRSGMWPQGSDLAAFLRFVYS